MNASFVYQVEAKTLNTGLTSQLGKKLGKYRLALDVPEHTADVQLYDCFDQTIQQSNRVLYRSNDQLTLISQNGLAITQPCDQPVNFVAKLAPGQVKTELADVSPLRALLAGTKGLQKSVQGKLLDGNAKTVARLSIQCWAASPDSNWHCFITFEPVRGYVKAQQAVLKALANNKALQPHQVLSPTLIFNALGYIPSGYDPKPTLHFKGKPNAITVASQIIHTYIDVARANEAGVIADYDTEFLHDYRVSLRKVRSVLSLFKGVYSAPQTISLKQAFSEHMNPTGQLRDLDVYLLEKDRFYSLLPASLHQGLDLMFTQFEKERAAHHHKLSKRFASQAYQQAMAALSAQFSANSNVIKPGPQAKHLAASYAQTLIWKRYQKVCKIARAIDAQTPDEQIHELRIDCKKLRYLMEFFAPLFAAKSIKALIKSLKVLQETLGLFNDYSVQQESLQAYLATHANKGTAQHIAIAQSVGALRSVLSHKQQQERDQVVAKFADFDNDTTRNEFRQLFKQQESS
ncbi:CHAD domain-containing protein [Neiella marina]|uniref:CHAD domain-containing protein n=1 Tax=Neiella holothuriorum TaxID=2870530 RepID=A0ABS7ED35_9GAMM|nr:CHAD domain-containing protein [Neiella holothuriorum]MBW8190247.1 CHAD domain-containing protein [Neiella holothuriorum]